MSIPMIAHMNARADSLQTEFLLKAMPQTRRPTAANSVGSRVERYPGKHAVHKLPLTIQGPFRAIH